MGDMRFFVVDWLDVKLRLNRIVQSLGVTFADREIRDPLQPGDSFGESGGVGVGVGGGTFSNTVGTRVSDSMRSNRLGFSAAKAAE
jgi:hypothetical protein